MEAITNASNTHVLPTQLEHHHALQELFRAYPTPIEGAWQESPRNFDVKSIFSNVDSRPSSADFDAAWTDTVNCCNYEPNGWLPPSETMPVNGRSYSEGDTRKMKRQAQNRAAQRAFRERKEIRVQNLYEQIAELDAKTSKLDKENEALRSALELARAEIERLTSMKSVSKVLESVSVDQNAPAEQSNGKQGPTIVLRLDLGGLASLLSREQTPSPLFSGALSPGVKHTENII